MIEFIKKQDMLDKIISVADGERYLPPMIDAVNEVKKIATVFPEATIDYLFEETKETKTAI